MNIPSLKGGVAVGCVALALVFLVARTEAIDFDEHGRKVFATRLVTLQASNEPAPHKAAVRKRAVKKKKAEAS